MEIYIVLFFILLIGIPFGNNKSWLLISLLIFAVLIGIRAISVGTDTKAYMAMYDFTKAYGYEGYPEPGYGYAQVLFCKMGCNFTVFQTAMSLIMSLMLYFFIRRASSNYALSLFVFYSLYFVMYSMNVFRQVFADVILLWAYFFLFKDQKIRFIIVVIIASMFHMSSVVALVLLFLGKVKIYETNKTIMLIIASILLGIALSPQLYSSIAGGYAHYLTDSDEGGIRTGTRLLLSIALCLFWSSLFLICYLSTDNRMRSNFWFKMFFLATIMNNVCLRMELGLRILWILSISEIITLPLCTIYSKKISKSTITGIIVLSLTFFFFALLFTNSADVVPYESELIYIN